MTEKITEYPICNYKNKPCEFWGIGDNGCMALDPSQCPYNSQEDVKVIRHWQTKIERSESV